MRVTFAAGDVASRLSVTRRFVQDWIEGKLSAEERDMIEVRISLLEMRLRSVLRKPDVPTERVLQLA